MCRLLWVCQHTLSLHIQMHYIKPQPHLTATSHRHGMISLVSTCRYILEVWYCKTLMSGKHYPLQTGFHFNTAPRFSLGAQSCHLFVHKMVIFKYFNSLKLHQNIYLNTPQKLVKGFLSPAAPKARDGRYCNAPRLSVRPSVRLSVCLSVRPSVCPSRLVFAL